jgi:hypothetical protein
MWCTFKNEYILNIDNHMIGDAPEQMLYFIQQVVKKKSFKTLLICD